MKFNDLQSKDLLPRFAHDVDWIQLAFDVVVKDAHARAKSIDAPLTLEAIHALTDDELQAFYEQYGIAQYYPDLSRETRDQMLYEMCRIYRFLGTPRSIEILCNYIFDGLKPNIEVFDNLAFDEFGQLVNESLLDLFDVKISPLFLNLTDDVYQRILENIISFCRNSQTLRYIYFDFYDDFECRVAFCENVENPCVIIDFPNDDFCVVTTIVIGGTISETSEHDINADADNTGGLLVPGAYAYQDGDLLDMTWDFGGMVEEFYGLGIPIGGVLTSTSDSVWRVDEFGGVIDLDRLPIVHTLIGAVGTLSQQGTQASVADGGSVYHWRYVDSAYQLSTIGAGNTISIVRINNNRGEDIQRGVGWIAERTSDGYIQITNHSGTTYTNLYGAWLAYCDSTSVTVVTVYKLSNPIAYNAFKCVLNGTDYYYVLDNTVGSTMDWTDDLASIGYTLTPFTFEEFELYPNSSSTSIRYMSNITSSSEISSATTTFRKQLFLDSSKTAPFVYDTSKIYVKGSYPNGWWTPDPVQSTADMPSSTTGTISSATFALILVGALDSTIGVNGYGWVLAITNYNGNNSTSGDSRYYVRVFSPGPLPTVSIINNFGSYNWLKDYSGTAVTVNSGDSVPLYISSIGRAAYNSNKSYAILQWQVTQQVIAGRTEFSIINDSGYLSAKNVFGSSLSFLQARVAVCSSNLAEVVTVHNTSNEAFNAFKYILNGTDYYYVLDGTQTDWTDDLESIGYSLVQQIDLILALRYSPPSGPFLSKTFPANDWWWSGIISQQDADSITAAGIGVITQADSSKWYCGPYGGLNYNPEFDYELLALYSDMGETPVTFNSSNFYLGANDYSSYPSYPGALFIHAINAFNTSTMTYKIRATRGGNRNNVMYLSQDRSNVTLSYNSWMPLYRRDGVVVEYTGTLPTIIGYFSDPDTYTMNGTSSGAYEFRNNNGTLEVRYLWPNGITGNRIVVQWT